MHGEEETEDIFSRSIGSWIKSSGRSRSIRIGFKSGTGARGWPGHSIRYKMDVLSGQDLDQGTEEPRVIRTKTLAIIPQSLDEAVVQMDLLNQDFLVFRNSGNDRINVLYRRQDGDYLLVEPEAE